MPKGLPKNRPLKKNRPGWLAFENHRLSAKRRGIPFLFDYETWWSWWQVDGRWEQRGRSKDALVMARHGDTGPYSTENVYCATNTQNLADVPAEVRKQISQRARVTREANGSQNYPWKGVRAGHPRARAVITPLGRFDSAALAAEAHGIHQSSATEKARNGWNGWRYE